MKWKKLGKIFDCDLFGWPETGVMLPTPYFLDNDIIRIFFGGRDLERMSRIGFVDIDLFNIHRVCNFSRSFIVDIGELGCFDDCGVTPGSIVDLNGIRYFYYTGMSLHVRTMFTNSIGLLISKDNPSEFHRYSKAPVMTLNYNDPYHVGTPFVIFHDGIFKMWYLSGTAWKKLSDQEKARHYYLIKYAESDDGINWKTSDRVCIDFRGEEYAICRPCVLYFNGKYEMWYTYRGVGSTYRIGYAESQDGISWERKDNEVGIDISADGWDSEMICYPYIFEHCGRLYMLYNGNGYGKTGFGLAVLEDE